MTTLSSLVKAVRVISYQSGELLAMNEKEENKIGRKTYRLAKGGGSSRRQKANDQKRRRKCKWEAVAKLWVP